ncbi:GNAT family N-acetyltransferase [Clostridium grantii]|uniref:Ribosomal-protein-alanine N-acetyltransferase n=1 Tax=Clostridium grantii DSM 8605 TaxID=1121316 RepID=A0A1M5S7H7_9CLOT|nr:GNAT family N-acetyltransferase [Clostridium grantii]SHH34446.1 ribosomal-protein-alanine N-acetyltransferase [Clostridium grantii DSM 8605]
MEYLLERDFVVIETERLILRRIDLSDNTDLFEIFSSEKIMMFYGMFPMKELIESDNLIMNFNKGFEEGRTIRWGIELKKENKLIGTCGYHNWNKKNFRAEIGYELSDKYWRKGYITEAVNGIIEYGFHHMCLNRIEALVYPENIASQESLRKLGFVKEGLLREYAFLRNKKQDLIMYSLLKR